jgi:hypothetical protein
MRAGNGKRTAQCSGSRVHCMPRSLDHFRDADQIPSEFPQPV